MTDRTQTDPKRVAGAVAVVLVLAAVLLGGGWMVVRDQRAIDEAKTRIAAVDLAFGQCFDDDPDDSGDVVVVVDCAESHEGEVVGALTLTDQPDDLPSRRSMDETVLPRCVRAFGEYTRNHPAMHVNYVHADAARWGRGDRRVRCTAVDPGRERTGSLR